MRPFSSALLVAFALVLGLERGNLPHAAAGDVGDQAPGSDPVPPSSPPPSYEEAIEVSGSTPTTKSGHRHTTENPLRALEIHPIYRWLKDRDAPTNCFFVVVARLLRTTVAEIIRRSGLDLPPNGRGNGITLDDVFAAFERLGIRLRILSFRGPVEPSAPGPIQHLIYCRRTVRGRRWRRLPPREIGVVYVRPTESIHAVVVRNAGRAGTLYVDYQADPAGRDAWPDVRQSNICFYFYVDEEASSANFAVAHRWRTVEASAQEAAAEAAQPNSDDASALPNSNDENVGFVEDITDALNVPFEDPTENTETVHPDQQAQPPPEEVATTNTPNTGDGPQDTMETNAESMGDATAVEDIAMPNTSNTGGDVQDTVDNTPVPLQQTPTEQEAEAAASSIPTPTAGVDLQTLNPSMVARIFAGLLNRDMCIRYLVLVANARERFPEKPHFHGKRAEEVKDTSCAELKYEVERSQACSQITSLEIGIFLSPDRGSGTYDYILATIGNETVELGFNTNGGYDAWKQVDLKSAFSSDTIDIRRVQSLELVDKGRTWTISLFRNDEWKVKDIILRAQCDTPGFRLEYDSLMSLNKAYRHPAATTGGVQPYEPAVVAKFDINPLHWYMAPCYLIKELHYEFKVGSAPWSGSWDSLSLSFQRGKHSINLTKEFWPETEVALPVNLTTMFGSETVDIRTIKEMSVQEEYSGKSGTDWWKFASITLKATCAYGPTKMAMDKYKNINRWFGYDRSQKTVWSGDFTYGNWEVMA